MDILLIERELQRLLGHRGFAASERLRTLLAYLVDQTLSGRQAELNQRQIAEDVFDRGAEFDPENDSIVRVEVNKLRRALKQFYLEYGSADGVRITVPVRTYVPEFAVDTTRKHRAEDSLTRLVILPAEPGLDSSEGTDLCRILTEELTVSFSRNPNVCILRPESGLLGAPPDLNGENCVLLFNLVYFDEDAIVVNSRLQSPANNEIIWADSVQAPAPGRGRVAALRRLAQQVANLSLDPYCGKANPGISALAEFGDISEYHPQVASYQYYRYLSSLSEDSYQTALVYLQETRARFPDNHVIECMHADLVRAGYVQGFRSEKGALDSACDRIRRILNDHPDCLVCRIAYCYVLLYQRDLNALHALLRSTLESGSLPASFAGELALLMMLAGHWDEGQQIMQEKIVTLANYPEFFRYPLALNAIRENRFAAAVNILGETPGNYSLWYWLILIVAHANLGAAERLKAALEGLRTARTNPRQAAFRTIDSFILEPALLAAMYSGLEQAGFSP